MGTYANRGGQDSSIATFDLGAFRLRKGFKLGINLMDDDPIDDDRMGSGVVVFNAPDTVGQLDVGGATVRIEFAKIH